MEWLLSSPVYVISGYLCYHTSTRHYQKNILSEWNPCIFERVGEQCSVVGFEELKDCANNVNPHAKHDVSLEPLFNVNLSKACTDCVLSPLIM